MINIAILGASGSIGRQTLDVCNQINFLEPGMIKISALSANQDWRFLSQAARIHLPKIVALNDATYIDELKAALADLPIKVVAGEDGVKQAATCEAAEMIVAAISGMAGLAPLLAAIEAGKKKIALANKEALVAAGEIVTDLTRQKGVTLLPVDSEHSAIWQCLQGERMAEVSQLILTASGGPFWNLDQEQLTAVTPKQALAHPNWDMGAKITIDSATMVNKGLEVIEAHWLFALPYQQIDVIIHRESIIHSMVAFADGNVKALLSTPDMRQPIQYAILEQERRQTETTLMDLAQIGQLSFFAPDQQRFPALAYFLEAGKMGGTAAAYLNGANEALVEAFLQEKIAFNDISTILGKLLEQYAFDEANQIEKIYTADKLGREAARAQVSL